MDQEVAVEKALEFIKDKIGLTDPQSAIVEQHLAYAYAAGYDEATTILLKRPRQIEQWYMGVLLRTWPNAELAAKSVSASTASINRAASFDPSHFH